MIRKAAVKDVKEIPALINTFAKKDLLLPRALSDIYQNLRDFFVYEQDSRIVGCAALHVLWDDLAEVKSLATLESYQRKGIGTALVEACLNEASSLGVTKNVFTLTYLPKFFERCGFRQVEKEELPHKVWRECVDCPKFPDCGEVAMVIDI